MRTVRAALALLLSAALPVRAETTADPLWYLLSTYVLASDEKAVKAEGDGPTDANGLADLQADLLVLSDGLESFRDEAQVRESLARLEPRMSPELRPFFKDRASALDATYRTLAVTDYTWARRFPDPPCEPDRARRVLLDGRDGLFQTETGEASPWLASLLGPRSRGKSAERALDEASSRTRLVGAEYEKVRARVRRLTSALASDRAVGSARAKLYCLRASAFELLAASHRAKDAEHVAAGRSFSRDPAESVFLVVWKDKRAAATLLQTSRGPMVVTDAAIVAETDQPYLFAYSGGAEPVALRPTVARRNAELSVAVLTLPEDPSWPALGLAASAPLKDEFVTAVGHTLVSGPWTKTSGLVTAVGEVSFQTDAALSPELSGAPVLNDQGEVAGMLVLRAAAVEEGRWPIAIPAPVLARWLENPADTPAVPLAPQVIEDAGTAAILSRARPAPTEAGLGPWNIPPMPPPPPSPRGVCMARCGGGSSSPRSSYSSGGSSGSGGAVLGQALGELGAVLIIKGLSALFRGLGKLFKGDGAKPKAGPIARAAPAPRREPPPKPPEPPKPECKLVKVDAPARAGSEPFEVAVKVSCNDSKIPLSGHSIIYTFEWDGKKSKQTVTLPTDGSGVASLMMQVSNVEVDIKKVMDRSERSQDELDRYDPDKQEPEEPEAPAEPTEDVPPAVESPLPAPLVGGRGVAPITAADVVTAAPAAAVTTTAAAEAEAAIAASMRAAKAARFASATAAGRAITLAGKGKAVRVIAVLVLSPAAAKVAAAAIVVVTVKVTFDIGWSIGTVVEEKFSEVQRAQTAYDKSVIEFKRVHARGDYCPSCEPYSAGTIGYLGPHTDHPHFPIEGPHLNLFFVNQNPKTYRCFWNKSDPSATAPPPLAGWINLNTGFPPLRP